MIKDQASRCNQSITIFSILDFFNYFKWNIVERGWTNYQTKQISLLWFVIKKKLLLKPQGRLNPLDVIKHQLK